MIYLITGRPPFWDVQNMTYDTLNKALDRHQLQLTDHQIEQLERYCALLWEWNEKLNLTRHTDYDRFVSRDVVDALELAKHLELGERVLDIGTGGGVPGVLLAVLRDDLEISLSESVGKKAHALQDIVARLELDVPVLADRAEHVLQDLTFDTLTARAVGPLWKILKWLAPHWSHFHRLLAIKGPRWIEERGEARHRGLLKNLELRRVADYPLAGTSSQSVIVQIRPKRQVKSARAR